MTRLRAKLGIYFVALALFASHTFYELSSLLRGRQPELITTTSPLRALTQSALAFDRPVMFYDHFVLTLRYPKGDENYPRMRVASLQSNYYERLVFQHWPYYFSDDGRTAALKALLCRPTALLRALHGTAEIPLGVAWTAWSVPGNTAPPELRVEAACR